MNSEKHQNVQIYNELSEIDWEVELVAVVCVSSHPIFSVFGSCETRVIQFKYRSAASSVGIILCSWSTKGWSSRKRRLEGPSVKGVRENPSTDSISVVSQRPDRVCGRISAVSTPLIKTRKQKKIALYI